MNSTYEARKLVAVFGLALALTSVSAFGKYTAQCNYISHSFTQADGKKVNAGTTSAYNLCIQRRTKKGSLDITFNVVGERIHLDKAEVHSLERLPSGNYLVKGFFVDKFILFAWEVSTSGAEVGWAYYPVDCADPAYSSQSGCVNAANTSPVGCSVPGYVEAYPGECSTPAPAPEPTPAPAPSTCIYADPVTGVCIY